LVATDEYLYVLLDYEFKKREDPEGRVLITELFEQTEILHVLDRLRGAPDAATPPSEPKANRCRAEQLLKRLSEVRDEGWTYERALVRLKRNYLMFHAVIVLFFLVLLGVVIISAGGSVGQPSGQVLLVTLAGALGSTLAATRKLRDAVVRLNDLVAVIVCAVVQAFIGASLGLVAWLLLKSGAIGGDGTAGWERYGLVAFAAGFSEPFALGLIARFIRPD